VIKNACGDKVTGGGCGRRATIQTMPRMSTITATSTEKEPDSLSWEIPMEKELPPGMETYTRKFFFHSIRRQRRKKNSFRRHKRGRHEI